ncbi:MAG: hypothetical protein ACLP4R_01815 [Solirubrobacteraceae bacterium]
MPAIVTLMSGERYRLTGCCADLAPQINTARAEGLLVELTRDRSLSSSVRRFAFEFIERRLPPLAC